MIENDLRSEATFTLQWLFEHTIYLILAVTVAAVACFNLRTAVVAAFAISIGCFSISRMKSAVVVFASLIPFDRQIPSGFAQVFYIDLLFGVLAIPIFIDLTRQHRSMNYRALSWLPFLVYALLTTIGRSSDTKWLLETSLRFFILIIFALGVAIYGEAERLVFALGWATVPVVAYSIYQLLVGGLGPLYLHMSGASNEEALDTMGREWLSGRAYGFFEHPNALGCFCAVVTVSLLALEGHLQVRRKSMHCYILAAVAFLGVLSSGSRGALMGLISAVIVLLLCNGKMAAKRTIWGVVFIAFVFVVAKKFDLLPVARETGGIDEFTRESRLVVWGQALLLFLQHPLIGNGWLNFHQLGVLGDTRYGSANHAHNWYLNTLVESGIIGFVLLFGPLCWLLIRNLRAVGKDTTALIASTGLIVVIIHDLVDVTLATPQLGLLFAMFFGLAAKAPDRHTETVVTDRRESASLNLLADG